MRRKVVAGAGHAKITVINHALDVDDDDSSADGFGEGFPLLRSPVSPAVPLSFDTNVNVECNTGNRLSGPLLSDKPTVNLHQHLDAAVQWSVNEYQMSLQVQTGTQTQTQYTHIKASVADMNIDVNKHWRKALLHLHELLTQTHTPIHSTSVRIIT